MKFAYVDDIRFPKLAKPGMFAPGKAFGFAAYVIEADALGSLLDLFDAQKKTTGLRGQDPIKRSMDSGMQSVYKRIYGEEGLQRFEHAKTVANPIGRSMLQALLTHDAKVYTFLTLPYSNVPREQNLVQWAFDMLLQRLGFVANRQGAHREPSLVITVDQPVAVDLLESYRSAFYHGCTSAGIENYCGPLRQRGVLPCLSFASTPYTPPLQIADFVAGACRDFVRWCRTGENVKEVIASFLPLVPAFASKWDGTIEGYGIRLDPYAGFSVTEKIALLEATAQRAESQVRDE